MSSTSTTIVRVFDNRWSNSCTLLWIPLLLTLNQSLLTLIPGAEAIGTTCLIALMVDFLAWFVVFFLIRFRKLRPAPVPRRAAVLSNGIGTLMFVYYIITMYFHVLTSPWYLIPVWLLTGVAVALLHLPAENWKSQTA